MRFFTPDEQAGGTALCDRLLDLEDACPVPVLAMIDFRLAEAETDGWRYEGMPEDGRAWRGIARCARRGRGMDGHGGSFATRTRDQQTSVIQAVQDLGSKQWHGLPAAHVWSLWTRYACTAFYAHPSAWNEIGFPGPAYPRGYKNLGVDARDPREAPDARPALDPIRADGEDGGRP